ncbi:MAG TPA: choice-of-anchor tandem repeat GloVer-containing protein, partial [Candidatus Acidoferrum sp.]|nr:choice-of-anchor tandem repeat GloVer-containing protein [Candidatus Acidoferrum sp.]
GAEKLLYSFSGGNDGGLPNTALVLGTDGNFYGTTSGAGANYTGAIYKITPAGAFSSVYSFPALNPNAENSAGAYPSAALVMGRDGNLYGSCLAGGANGNGTIFRVTNPAFVSPYQAPLIATQPPARLSGLAGTWATLNVTAKGAPPLRYQWMINKTNVLSDGGDISGSATSALVVGPLQAGDAGSYSVTVANNYGATNSIVTILTVTPDTTPPGVKIASPAAGARTNAPVFAGTAWDNARVTNVLWWLTNLNAGPVLSGLATLTQGGSNWSFAATPFPGTNILAVRSVDSSGLTSKPALQTFFYKVTNSLGLWAGGDGIGAFSASTASVRNDPVPANGAALNIGEGYSITAVPLGCSLFSNWVCSSFLGVSTNTGAALPFVMQSNMVLTANFATNFFVPAHGTYNGLFANANAVAAESSGMLQGLLLATNGTFSGQLLKAGTTYHLAGRFDVTGHFSTNLGPASAPGGVLKVNLMVDRVARQIVGTVSNALWNASLTAEMAGTNLPSAEYTVLLAPAAGAPANAPPGEGFAQATNHLGMVAFSGKLADGTVFTPAAAESPNDDVPLYASLYGNTGLLFGWINLANLGAAAPGNTLVWIKKASRATAFYTNGFTNTLLVQGGPWTNPPAKTPALTLSQGQLVISNASLFLLFTNVSVSTSNTLVKIGAQPTNSLTGSIAPATGLLTLSFGNGNGKAASPALGAVAQGQTNGGGFFLGTTNAGLILLLPPQ